jgi:signal transduction histidine kinase/CheY-like chemotaxis protein
MTHSQRRQWADWMIRLTPARMRQGRMPFMFYAGLALMLAISLLSFFTPAVVSAEGRNTFIAVIAVCLVLMNAGATINQGLGLVTIYAVVHISLAAYFSQGLYSPRINWLFLIPMLMSFLISRKAGWIWTAAIIAVFTGVAFLTIDQQLPNNTPLGKQHEIYNFLVYVVVTGILVAITMIFQGFSQKALMEIQNRNTELELKRQELQAILDIRDQFIASVSHELRTPMNAIMGFNDLIRENQAGNAKAQEVLQLTQQSGEHLLTVINDVLDYSQFQSGKLGIHPEAFELRKTIDSAAALFSSRLKSMRLTFTSEVDDTLPEWIMADRHRLMQILVNLLGNAIKFTQQGFVKLRVQRSGTEILFEVHDSGIGISQDQHELVFERFSQATVQTQSTYGGNGLGLAISKRLAELMGGGIGVQSELGVGSCFWLKLPLLATQAPTSTIETQRKAIDIRNLPLRFLIVDDMPINRLLLKQMLLMECPQAKISEAENGLSALLLMKIVNFDMVFMDMLMPQMDGIEACQRIRQELPEPFNRTPLLGLTANVNAIDRERFIQAGADGFLLKPFDRKTLMAEAERLLSGLVEDQLRRIHSTQ